MKNQFRTAVTTITPQTNFGVGGRGVPRKKKTRTWESTKLNPPEETRKGSVQKGNEIPNPKNAIR